MLSKCANPECPATFRYLHEGKIFYLSPTPEVQIAMGLQYPTMQERFWLCSRCSKEMTLTWGGADVKLVRLPVNVVAFPAAPTRKAESGGRRRPRTRAASAGREDK